MCTLAVECSALRGPEEDVRSLGTELQAELVSCLWWVLETCIRASAGAARAHTC